MKKITKNLVFLSLGFLVLAGPVFGMSSTNYQINWDSMNAGGSETSTSDNYKIKDTLSEIATGASTSAGLLYEAKAGYRQGTGTLPVLSFSLVTQNNSTKLAYAAFSGGAYTVTASSTPSGFSVDDYIAVVENEGGSQLVAIGKISNIAGNVITVDKWNGNQATMSANPAGSDDYIYKLSGASAALSTLSKTAVKTSVTGLEVLTNASGGYTASVYDDGNLRTASGDDINDVADGTVTAGSEEYGISTAGADAAGAGDFAITTTNTSVATSAGGSNNRTAIIYQASIADSTEAGSYSHSVTYTVTANF